MNNKQWITIWNELGGIKGLAELFDDSWFKVKKRKPTGKKIVWSRYKTNEKMS